MGYLAMYHIYTYTHTHMYAGENVRKELLGEMVQLTLRSPRNGRAQHMRIVSMVTLAPDFEHIMSRLHKIYAKGIDSSSFFIRTLFSQCHHT